MNFVDEKDGGLPLVFQTVGRACEYPPHIGDVRFNPTETLKFALRLMGNNLGERSFARARRTVKDERLNAVRFDGASKKLSRRENVGLANKIIQMARTH